jgi:hypothetical protein
MSEVSGRAARHTTTEGHDMSDAANANAKMQAALTIWVELEGMIAEMVNRANDAKGLVTEAAEASMNDNAAALPGMIEINVLVVLSELQINAAHIGTSIGETRF